MQDEYTILAPRRLRIGYGETSPQRAAFVEAAWHDPARARAEALEARLRYWLGHEAALTQLIQQTQIAGKRARTRYNWELEELYSNLDGVREALRAVEGELASIGVTLSGPFQPPTGSKVEPPRRRRRRVVSDQGRARRRRVAAAAG
jgi:hypothetical protein